MDKLYVFSKASFIIRNENQIFHVNKNCTCKISNIKNNETIFIVDPKSEKNMPICLDKMHSCNFYRYCSEGDIKLLNIITTSFDNLVQKLTTQNSEIYIYQNAIRLIYDGCCYTYNFCGFEPSKAIEHEDKIYIFNNKNLLFFDKKNLTFSLLKVERFSKNNNNFTLFCKISRIFGYFLLFVINFSSNSVKIKKFKTTLYTVPQDAIFYYFFYLLKFNFV